MRTPLRNFYNQIIGWIEEDANGNQIGKDFYLRIVGRYRKDLNVTEDFYHRIVGRGNLLASLIQQADDKNRNNK